MLYQKNIRLNSTHYFIMKIQIKGSFTSLHLIIHQILTLKALLIFTKMYCKTIFLFSDCYYSCIRYPLTFQKESFRKNLKTNHGNWWLEMKNCNMILIEKLQKYQHYHSLKLINMTILQVKKWYLWIKVKLWNKLSLLILL